MPPPTYTDAQLDAAIEALSNPQRFREAEAMVAGAAPKLGVLLAQAMEAGGWFAQSHDDAATRAATVAEEDQRLVAVRTLMAEEARMGMLVGVAVGWALAGELGQTSDKESEG